MSKPHELNQQMLRYLLSQTREQQEAIPASRPALIAWLGTEPGLEWLMASPLRDEIVVRDLLEYVSDKVGYDHRKTTDETAPQVARPWME